MQSGKNNTRKWLLEFPLEDSRYRDPMMGWTGNRDTKSQLKLRFDSEDEAVSYATRKGLDYEIIYPQRARPILRAYADNFTD